MAVTLYGFKTCDTVRNALAWLKTSKIEHTYFDYRAENLDPKVVDNWFARAGWENVLSRNSPTFKQLPDEVKASLTKAKAKRLMLAHTNLIKRPVLDTGSRLVFGFNPETYAQALGKGA